MVVNNEMTQDERQYLALCLCYIHRQEQPETTQTRTKRQQGNLESELRQGNVCLNLQGRDIPVIPSVKRIKGSAIELHLSPRPPNLPKKKQLQLLYPPSRQLAGVFRMSYMFLHSDLEMPIPIDALN
jgi:hypothetical protein